MILTILDTSNIPLEDLAQRNWIVADITDLSVADERMPAVVDAVTGTGTGEGRDMRLSGRLNVEQASSAQLLGTMPYVFKVPMPNTTSGPVRPFGDRLGDGDPYQLYRSFRTGGTIVCSYPTETSNGESFLPIYSVPTEWTKYVGPALTQVKSSPINTDTSVDSLTAVVRGENPLLAVYAWDKLVRSHEITHDAALNEIAAASGYRQACLVYTLINMKPNQSSTDDGQLYDSDLSQIVSAAKGPKSIEGVCMAAATELLWNYNTNAAARKVAIDVLNALDQHVTKKGSKSSMLIRDLLSSTKSVWNSTGGDILK
jgi:hypothetical protein